MLFLIHPDPHFAFTPVGPAKPRDKGQSLRLAFGWRAVVMPQRLLLWIALFIPGTWRLNQDLMAEQSLAFKCRKWHIGGQQQIMQ